MEFRGKSQCEPSSATPAEAPTEVLPIQLDSYSSTVRLHRPTTPAGEPVVILHGIQSHPGWFTGSADALAAAGHTVVQFTRRGSGSNTRDRGHARSEGQLIDDVSRVIEYVCRETSADRVHLVGISWGGKYAACYALDAARTRTLASLMLVAPGIAAQVNVSRRTRAAIALSSIFAPRWQFDIPLSDPALFTDNPQRLEFIRTDPDRLNRATARFLAVSRFMDWRLTRARVGAIAIPTTLILAGRDRIIDNDRTRAAVGRLTGGSATTIELAGAHTLEFESNPREYFATLVSAAKTPT